MASSSGLERALRTGVVSMGAVLCIALPTVSRACSDLTDCYKQASKLHYHGSNSDAERIQRETDQWAADVDRRVNQSSGETSRTGSSNRAYRPYGVRTQPVFRTDPAVEATYWRNFASSAYANGDWVSAINDLQKALSFTPNAPDLQGLLRNAEAAKAQADAAAAAARHQAELAAEAQAVQSAQQQAQADANSRVQSLQSIADLLSEAERAEARRDWSAAQQDYQLAEQDSGTDDPAIDAAIAEDQQTIRQAYIADRNAAAKQLMPGDEATSTALPVRLLSPPGTRGLPEPLGADALEDPDAGNPGTRAATGYSEALRQLRSASLSGRAALVADSPESARFLANLGFDTAGVPASGAFARPSATEGANGERYRLQPTVAYRALPAATRNNPVFKREMRQLVAMNVQRVQLRQREAEVQRASIAAHSPAARAQLQVTLSKLYQRDADIRNKENFVRSQSKMHFHVDAQSLMRVIQIPPPAERRAPGRTAQTAQDPVPGESR